MTGGCLQGRTFEVPECVPFRLTHNMIDAMVGVQLHGHGSRGLLHLHQRWSQFSSCLQGVAGYEGVFRKSCEVTMRVLREQCDPLVW